MICVEIEIGDDGQVTVGVCPPKEGSKEYMQPAQSVDEALQTARSLLSNPQQAAAMPGAEQDAAEEAFMRKRAG